MTVAVTVTQRSRKHRRHALELPLPILDARRLGDCTVPDLLASHSARLRGDKGAHPLVDRCPDVIHGLYLRVRNDPAVAAIGVSFVQLHAHR
jgi:hypothetical protein